MAKYHHKRKDGNKFQQFNLGSGTRYVFFQSLSSAIPLIYRNYILPLGQSLVSQAEAILGVNPLDQYQSNQFSRITQYINWIGSMAASEQANEEDFLKKTKLKFEKEGKLNPELKKDFDAFFANPGDNLLQIQNLINQIMHVNQKDREKIDAIYNTNMASLSKRLEQIQQTDNDLYKEYKQAFHTNLGKFNRMMNKLVKDTPEFKTSYANLIASRVSSVIYNLSRNNEIMETISNYYTSHAKISNEKLAQYLITYITQYINDLDLTKLNNTDGKTLAKEISNKLIQQKPRIDKIANDYVTTIMNATTQKSKETIRSIEEIALTTRRDTGRMFYDLTTAEQQDFISIKNGYGDKLNDLEKKFLTNFGTGVISQTSKNLEKASKIINKAIRAKAVEKFGAHILEAVGTELEEKASSMFKIRDLKAGLKNYLQVRISGPDMAEIQGDKEFRNFIVMNMITPGKSTSLKNDITAYISFNDTAFANNIQVNTQNGQAPLLTNLPATFMDTYKEFSNGTTDVAQAKKAYIQIIKEQLNLIEMAYKQKLIDDKQKQQLLDALQEDFFSGISIKDYQYGTQQFGFHGGSLGPNIEKIMNNVSEMYELGGISKTDAEILAFAAANCGSDALGSHLKEPLQTYILGAAATIMFDEGFAASEEFLNQMQQQLGIGGPKTLHLFRLQGGKYISASFVYSTIHKNLLAAYTDILSSINEAQHPQLNQVTINNNITEAMKPNYQEMPSAVDRWNDVSAKAYKDNANIQINFSFMANLLDTFEAIAKAFDV